MLGRFKRKEGSQSEPSFVNQLIVSLLLILALKDSLSPITVD
jgi:hypothetical protein